MVFNHSGPLKENFTLSKDQNWVWMTFMNVSTLSNPTICRGVVTSIIGVKSNQPIEEI